MPNWPIDFLSCQCWRIHTASLLVPLLLKRDVCFVERLLQQVDQLEKLIFVAKFGGATGNFNAHKVTFPNVNWPSFADAFIKNLGLTRLQTTTQIAHYDQEAAYFHQWIRINTILVDFCRDIWTYISMNYIKQKQLPMKWGLQPCLTK